MKLHPDVKGTLAVWLSALMVLPFWPVFVQAQQTSVNPYIVVSDCTMGTSLTVGARTYATVNTLGQVCSSVSGITANVSLNTSGLSTSSNQTSGAQKTQIVDSGGNVVTVTGNKLDVNATVNAGPTNVTQVDGTNIPQAGSGALAVVGAVSGGTAVVGGPVVIGGVSGSTVQNITVNNQTPAGTEYGVITRNIPSGTQTVSITGTPSVNVTTIPAVLLATSSGTGTVGGIVVNNASGGSAVNIQDGGNSITVDQATGTNLHVVCDSGCSAATGTNLTQVASVNILNAGLGAVSVTGAGSSGTTFGGSPVVIGGVSGTTIQSLNVNNQTPAGTEYGIITRNIPSGTQTISGTVSGTGTAGTPASGVLTVQGISSGTPQAITPSGSFVTDYAGTGATVFTLSATSGTVVTANTVLISQLSCYNTTGGSISFNRTDTAGTQFEVTFAVPANSNYERNYSYGEKMVGIKMWASAINSMNCTITAKQ